MKGKKTLVIVFISLVVILGATFGIRFLGAKSNVEDPILPVDEPTISCEDYRDVPLEESFRISPDIILEKAVAPAYYEFGNLREGAIIDTWVKNGRVSISGEDICYLAGDSLWILLYNGLPSSTTFGLSLINAPLEINHSDSTGKDYEKTPEGMLVGVVCPNKITIDAQSAVKVPIVIQFPVGLDYPDQWEFRLLITDLSVPGTVGTAHEVRFFCTMR
jgi:hypothetical protein